MKVPGLPEYYDYERSPNHFPTPPPIATMWEIGIAQLLHNDKVDAILTASDEWYEPESSRESIKWYKESTGKDMISTGFPLLIGPQEKTTLSESRPGEEGIISFLDQQKEKVSSPRRCKPFLCTHTLCEERCVHLLWYSVLSAQQS
jgi:hypothetical protein